MSDDRQCVVCAVAMRAGYYCCDEYYCSRACLDTDFDLGMTWEQHYEDSGDCYWTEWED